MIARYSGCLGCGALAVVLALGCQSSTAHAQNGYGLGFFNYGDGGYGINYRQPPYYALYPPVYYSYPVARPYGFSPFAYPPGVLTPEVKPSLSGQTYLNPFVPSSVEAVDVDQTTSVGRTYYNPFVTQAETAGKQPLANRVE
jgi:hypothetical protein